ncbi:MAG TPA: NACHT domain-containing protein, partial [Chloroflexi bacterium]|nr:NACHT domain-containing protein [Chloroflexota bacterium]
MTLLVDALLNLAAELAADLIKAGAGRLRDAAFGDAETRALGRAWERAFQTMLEEVAADLEEDRAGLVGDLFREFVRAEGVADALLDLALEGREPPLEALRTRFDEMGFDRETLPVDFDAALTALTRGLADALWEAAARPESPLHNRVSLVRVAVIHELLREQRGTLETIAATVARLEAQLGAAKYNLIFFGPVSGVGVGDRATVTALPPDLRPPLERALTLLTKLTASRQPPPYTEADLSAYLQAVVDECDTVQLPYAQEGRATLPLERIYVALRADRSSPAERKASYRLMQRLAQERETFRPGQVEEQVLYRLALLDPYAARYLLYDPDRWGELLQAMGEGRERTYHLAELVRRHRWLVLLGDPGSGKTTLARWLALQLARALQEGREEVEVPGDHVRPDAEAGSREPLGPARLPILVRIADYAAARWPRPGEDTRLTLLNYLGRHLQGQLRPGHRPEAVHALLRDYLVAGRVTLILDGLDEVTNPDQRQAVVAEIEGLIRDWVRDARGRSPLDPGYLPAPDGPGGGNQIIVTSRIVGYHLRPLHENLPHFVIQPMDDTAVRRFCHNWAAATGAPEQADALAKAILKHPNPHVREQMARNPLLLTILAQVFGEDPEEGLPARRAELYRRAARAVFGQRQDRWGRLAQAVGGPDPAKALERLLTRITACVAFHLHANPDYPAALADGPSVHRWLRETLAGELVEDYLAAAAHLSGFFVARGEGVYGFLHRQFQEYFAALHLVEEAKGREGPERWQPFLERLGDPNWREVLLLTVGAVEADEELGRREAVRLVEAVLEADDPTGGPLPHNLLFAAAALREVERPDADLVRRVAEGLIAAYRRDDEARFQVLHERVERAFAALPRRLGRRDPVGEALCAALTHPSRSDRPRAGSRRAGAGEEGSRLTRLAAAELVVKYKWYTREVARALARAWREHAEPAATLLVALQKVHDAHPGHFSSTFLPFRRAVEGEPELWARVEAHPHWRAVVRALYLAPEADLEAAAIVRDSSLTDDLLPLLRGRPEDREGLLALLWARFEGAGEDDVLGRDAGLALAHLGEGRLAALVAEGGKDRPPARAILAAAFLDLALDLDLDLTLALDLARALNLDL